MTKHAQALSVALLFVGTLACTTSQPATPTPAPVTAVKPVPVKDDEGNVLIEPEKVRSKQVQLDDRGLKTVTVGNANGDYALGCNMKVDNCVTPAPGKDYYLFDKNSKWKMPGATKSITLSWIQDWSVKYPNGENVALIPTEGGAPGDMGIYWLVSWNGKQMPIYLPKKIVLNWYDHDATFSIDLMISFVDGIEKQAAHSIAKYQTKVSEDSNQV